MMPVQRLYSLFVLLATLLSLRAGLFVNARKDGNRTTKLTTTTPAIRDGDNVLDDLINPKGFPFEEVWPNGINPDWPYRSFRSWRYIHHGSKIAEVAECSENGLPMKVKQIYYSPGDHISITCKVCEGGLDSNGKIKTWGWVAKVYDFFDHYQKNKKLQHADVGVQFLPFKSGFHTRSGEFEGSENSDQPHMPGNRIQVTEHGSFPHIRRQTFAQIGNTLHIHNAEARAAGVYFCYDDTAINLMHITSLTIISLIASFVIEINNFSYTNWGWLVNWHLLAIITYFVIAPALSRLETAATDSHSRNYAWNFVTIRMNENWI